MTCSPGITWFSNLYSTSNLSYPLNLLSLFILLFNIVLIDALTKILWSNNLLILWLLKMNKPSRIIIGLGNTSTFFWSIFGLLKLYSFLVITPILIALNIDLLWIGIMLAINLQTSFLTPPFGFSLFYLKSVSPKKIKTTDIYMGIIPFVIIQLVFLIFLFFNPDFIYLIPDFLKNYSS